MVDLSEKEWTLCFYSQSGKDFWKHLDHGAGQILSWLSSKPLEVQPIVFSENSAPNMQHWYMYFVTELSDLHTETIYSLDYFTPQGKKSHLISPCILETASKLMLD